MTPAARVQGAIEILDLVIEAARNNGPPADRIIADWFRSRRFAGSKDRRAVRELSYRAIRACGDIPESGRAAMLRLAETDDTLTSLFDGSNYGPEAVQERETVAVGGIAPPWLEERIRSSGIASDEAASMLERAPLDIRVNSLKADRESLVLPVSAEQTAAPQGLRLPAGTNVEQWQEWRDGLIEVQDTGSQLACLAVGARPGETVIDLCAGGGGKTLALAAAMENRGTLIVSDTDRRRLAKLEPRANRAGATLGQTVLLDPGKEIDALSQWQGSADAVLIDAPCSGTGTWRRNPESRWRLSPAQIARYAALQSRLLDIAAGLVRPGGRIIYVICSLLDEEGRDQATAFLERQSGWTAALPQLSGGEPRGEGIRLSPYRDGTDGFFIACFSRM